MEKAPEPSHARTGEELPSARWQYTILILHKILIYANTRSRHSVASWVAAQARGSGPSSPKPQVHVMIAATAAHRLHILAIGCMIWLMHVCRGRAGESGRAMLQPVTARTRALNSKVEVGGRTARLLRSAERGCQQASRVALTKFCRCNNSPGDDFAHDFRLASLLKLFKGSVESFAHLRNCLGSEHPK
jgi:hypothetical protein